MAGRKVLALDVDGVILDYLRGFMGYLEANGIECACGPDEVSDWSMQTALPGWSHEAIMDKVREFSVDPSFAEIPAVPGAVEAVRAIREEAGDAGLVAVTSAGTSPLTARMRERNLEPFGFCEVHVLPLGACKGEHLSRLPAGSVFVDDLYKNVVTAEKAGLTGVLYRRPYNAADSHGHVISCWPRGRETVSSLLLRGAAPAAAA